jgi:serine/threonine protein kinase
MLQELGHGSYGSVWKAQDNRTGKLVAIKFMDKSELHSKEEHIKFQNEAGILMHLDHPNIQSIYSVVEEPTRYCLVTELC